MKQQIGRTGVVALVAAALLGPGDAVASEVSVSGSALIYNAGRGEANRLSLLREATAPTCGPYNLYSCWVGDSYGPPVRVEDPGATVSAGTNCKQVNASTALCQVAVNGYASVTLGDGDDRFAASPLDTNVDGGPGNDVLSENHERDWLLGGDGNDTLSAPGVLDGGPGNDRLLGGRTLRGGPGADEMTGGFVEYGDRTAAVTVTQDGIANDGAAGEGDNVHDVAEIIGGFGDDKLSGRPAADPGGRPDWLWGGPGNDRLTAGSVDSQLYGDWGGGMYFDSGSPGNDTLVGGPGKDYLDGSSGRDVLRSADSSADTVDCGPDLDQAFSDSLDTLSGCERQTVG